MSTKSKLNPNALKWVKALESGKYKQGRNVLHKAGRDLFCCLGLACMLFNKSGGKLKTESAEVNDIPCISYDGEKERLPLAVSKWLGLKGRIGEFEGDNHSLAQLNDAGKRFKTIAKIIRSKPEGLFTK